MSALISCCNEALAAIAAGSIASLSEASIEARECNRLAAPLLAEVAAWHEWPFLVKRAALAQLPNDRPAEWNWRYAVPADLGEAMALRAVEDDAGTLPQGGPFTLPFQNSAPLAMLIEGGAIYCNVEQATLVYTRAPMDAADMPALLRRAFVLELAARLALPVKKDGKMREVMVRDAEVARLRAIADAANRAPRRAPSYVSTSEYARMGIGV